MGSCRRTLLGSVNNTVGAIAVGVAMRVLGARKSAVSTAMCNVTTAAQEAYLDRFHCCRSSMEAKLNLPLLKHLSMGHRLQQLVRCTWGFFNRLASKARGQRLFDRLVEHGQPYP